MATQSKFRRILSIKNRGATEKNSEAFTATLCVKDAEEVGDGGRKAILEIFKNLTRPHCPKFRAARGAAFRALDYALFFICVLLDVHAK